MDDNLIKNLTGSTAPFNLAARFGQCKTSYSFRPSNV